MKRKTKIIIGAIIVVAILIIVLSQSNVPQEIFNSGLSSSSSHGGG